MLYVIHGTDTQKSRSKLQSLVAVLQSKRPDATLFRLSPENWNQSFLDEVLSGVNLFTPKNIIVLDSLISNKESADYIEERIGELSESEHVCILFDSKINKDIFNKLEKKSEKIEEHNLKVSGDDFKKQPQTFAFADALASRNKVKSWALFQELVSSGLPAEEIHGVLWWQFKSVYLAYDAKSAGEVDMKPYTFSKCQGFKKVWKKPELENFLGDLVSMYHRAHRGEIDFMIEMEKLCLV
jgi:DNA polymerase III delta subunit